MLAGRRTGIGLAFECVGDAMGWLPRAEAQAKILLTLRSLSDLTPGFKVPRNPRGFMPSFVNSETGTHPGETPDKFALMACVPTLRFRFLDHASDVCV